MENNKTPTRAFEAAKAYDFNGIKECMDQGGEINVCDNNGKSILTHFIEAYLNNENNDEEKRKAELFDAHNEEDYDFWDSYIYDYQITPLNKRKYNILQELDHLFTRGVDPNLYEIVDGYAETPLYIAVCGFQDYYLTKYLLEHGADPGVWLFDENESPRDKPEMFLIEDMDVAILNGAKGRRAENVVAIAQLLWEYGLKNWSGLCIKVDSEKGVVEHHPMRVKF